MARKQKIRLRSQFSAACLSHGLSVKSALPGRLAKCSARSIFVLTVILLISHHPNASCQQVISSVSVEDATSYPLLVNDDGIEFRYYVSRAGNVRLFLRIGTSPTYDFSDLFETRGWTQLRISGQRLSGLVASVGSHSSSMLLTHRDALNDRYSESQIFLDFLMSAPYGTELVPIPSSPLLLKTSNTKRVDNPLAYAGIAIALGSIALGIARSSTQEGTGDLLLALGIGVGAVSINSTTKRVPDEELNRLNDLTNQRRVGAYRLRVRQTQEMNEMIRRTYRIEVRIRH